MRYPSFLKQGDTIGFPAPSFGCAEDPYKSAFENALKKLRSLGYGVLPGPNAFAAKGVGISNTPEECGRELTQMYLSKDTQALISCGGGELMCEILDHVDFEAIAAADPKLYMGYSDNTNMTFLLATLCDTAAVYGPCAGTFGMEPWHEAVRDALDLLEGKKLEMTGYEAYEAESFKNEENPLVPYNAVVPRTIIPWVPANASSEKPNDEIRFRGRLIGGCMDCLVNLTGTVYDRTAAFAKKYKDDGIIWFLEACDLNVFSIRRALWNMKHAGWFKHVRGFLIGRPLCMGQDIMGLNQYSAVTEALKDLEVPILMDLDIGHLPPMIPLLTGSMADVSLKGQQLSIKMELR
ncbi:MAG: LD-carboxypeptidase [Lachnospiraceae bacterium]|nr:LD-carboxypeptidase [Lachnospiraceae bacterium]